MRRSDYIADLVTIRAVKPYDIEAANFLKIGRHLRCAFAGLVGVVWRIGYSGAETWTTRATTRAGNFWTWLRTWAG